VKLFRHGLNQPESKYFPRETFCDFFVREPLRGGEPMQRITVQCVLTVNLFNQQIFTLLWIWYVFVLICNVYALISWSIRLGSSSRQYEFIHTRLARTSRPEIPRFRFDFKHATREIGDHVHKALVKQFLTEYLEGDGYFFIRLLAANASDFIVQEVLEQLWTVYVMKYGEIDATRAEDEFYQFRIKPTNVQLFDATTSRSFLAVDTTDSTVDLKRKPKKQNSDVGVGLLSATNKFEPV
ncbi:unnamed protein product, partial [Adineta steineri]